MSEGWIGVDLDGTLAHYDGWKGVDHIGEPIPAMLDRVKAWVRNGPYEVRIFTARVTDDDGQIEMIIRRWLHKHGLPTLAVTNVKDFDMVELWDDRAVQVIPNTGQPIGTSTRGLS